MLSLKVILFNRRAAQNLHTRGFSESEFAADDCDVDSLIRPVQNLGTVNSAIRKRVTVRFVPKRRYV